MDRAVHRPLDKADDYFEADRSAFLDWIGGTHRSVLDVGCASGANAPWFRAHGARRLVGIEPDGTATARAAERFDLVIPATVEEALPTLAERFDLIVCADVLEHLVDPWSVVRELRTVAKPGGRLAISMPNIRFYRTLARIAFGAGFRYEERGILDATHLRFFTRATLVEMVEEGGWQPRRIAAGYYDRPGEWLGRLTHRRSDEWFGYEWYLLADTP